MNGFPFGVFLLIGLALIFFGSKHPLQRKDHSRAILDQSYAEEKISVEEYMRKKTIIEEE